jgi:hypothetical protein
MAKTESFLTFSRPYGAESYCQTYPGLHPGLSSDVPSGLGLRFPQSCLGTSLNVPRGEIKSLALALKQQLL